MAGKSASERPIWSAFNGLEGRKEGGMKWSSQHFFLLWGKVLSLTFWNNSRSRFFEFPVTVFIVHEFFLRDTQAALATIVLSFLSQLNLFDSSQTKWRILPVWYKQWISERLRARVLLGDAGAGKIYLKIFFFCPFLSSLFSQNFILLPSGRCWECLWSSKGAFPFPCLPKIKIKKPTYTFHKHTLWITPSICHLKALAAPQLQEPMTLPHHFGWTPVWTSWTGWINWRQDEGFFFFVRIYSK